MTKKGIILIIILAILLLMIIGNVILQNNKPHKVDKKEDDTSTSIKEQEDDEFALNITDSTGFDLQELKSYKIPILIQFGSPNDEICMSMKPSIEKLNKELRGKAIIKFFDTDKYADLWNDSLIEFDDEAMQLLINSDGSPYNDEISTVMGYKKIENEDGKHIYTVHDGDLTLDEMKVILNKMAK